MSVSLKTRVLTSGASIAAGQFMALLLRLISTLIMTRLLVPEAFGIVALASVVQTMVTMLSDVGITQALVQSRNGSSQIMLNTAWVLQIARGVLIFSICLCLAGALRGLQSAGLVDATSTYGAADLPLVIAVASLASLVQGFQSTKVIAAERSVNYPRVVILEVASQACGLLFMAIAGWLTRSIWALVVGAIITTSVKVLLSHIALQGPANRLSFDWTSAREIVRFGKWIFLASAIFVVASQGDRLLIGAWADAATLGLYSIALSLATLVDGTSSRIFASVGMSALSETARESPQRFRDAFYRLRLPFDVTLLTISGIGFATGHLVVNVLYDARYAAAGHMLEILFLGMLATRMALCGHAYMALGHPRLLIPINLLKTVTLYGVVPVAYARFGIEGAIWAVALHELPIVPLLLYLNHRMRILNLRFELCVLLCWPAGYLIGLAIVNAWNAWIA